jgi:hypothetical protein
MGKSDSHETRTADGIASIALLQLFGNTQSAVNPGSAPGFQATIGSIICVSGLTAGAMVIPPPIVDTNPNDCISFAVVDADGSASLHRITVVGDTPISGDALGMGLTSTGGNRAGAIFFYSRALGQWVVLSCCAVAVSPG